MQLPVDMKRYQAEPDAFAAPMTPDEAIFWFCALMVLAAILHPVLP